MDTVSILIIDDDQESQAVIRQVLDAEGWRLQIAPVANLAFQQMATGDWTLVIVNVAMTGLNGALYNTLKELALAPAVEAGKKRLRVLFLVPESMAPAAQPVLESERLPYALKPFNLHDFLDKVSDLLLEAEAIPEPIRQVRREGLSATTRRNRRDRGRQAATGLGARRDTGMFANRDDYSMTEEEIADYERQEQETQRKKKKKEIRND
jgi:DNA-binding NtrC family response regulator